MLLPVAAGFRRKVEYIHTYIHKYIHIYIHTHIYKAFEKLRKKEKLLNEALQTYQSLEKLRFFQKDSWMLLMYCNNIKTATLKI